MLNRFPLESSRLAVETRKVQKEYLKVRLELNATSSQDQFAKWAKLRRQHDKLLEELEKKSAQYPFPPPAPRYGPDSDPQSAEKIRQPI